MNNRALTKNGNIDQLTSNFYSVLYYNSEIWPSSKSGITISLGKSLESYNEISGT